MRRKGMTDFEAFAHARTPHLLRSAWLLCGDTHAPICDATGRL